MYFFVERRMKKVEYRLRNDAFKTALNQFEQAVITKNVENLRNGPVKQLASDLIEQDKNSNRTDYYKDMLSKKRFVYLSAYKFLTQTFKGWLSSFFDQPQKTTYVEPISHDFVDTNSYESRRMVGEKLEVMEKFMHAYDQGISLQLKAQKGAKEKNIPVRK